MRRLSTKGGTREGGRGDLDRYLVDVRRYFSQKKTVESAEQSQQAAGQPGRQASVSETGDAPELSTRGLRSGPQGFDKHDPYL